MRNFFRDFFRNEEGLTAVEYAIAGGLVVAGLAAAFITLGEGAKTNLNQLITALG